MAEAMWLQAFPSPALSNTVRALPWHQNNYAKSTPTS